MTITSAVLFPVSENILKHVERAVEALEKDQHSHELLTAAKRVDGVGDSIRAVMESDAQSIAVLRDWIARVQKRAKDTD